MAATSSALSERKWGRCTCCPGRRSATEELGEYDSKRHSALTLRELERYIALDIVGSYHQSIHSSLGRPPIAVWREHEGEIPLRLPQDRMRFWLAFLPEQERTLRPDGIHLFKFRYWSPALTADVGRTGRRLLVKYDPRDLSRIFVRRPSGSFVEARYADVTLPAVTLREVMTARRTLLEKGRSEVNMRTIMRTVMAQRELVDDAVKKRLRSGAGRPIVRNPRWMMADGARFAESFQQTRTLCRGYGLN